MNFKEKISRIKDKIFISHFFKSILTLSSGIVIGQIINFICTPIIGRLYSPAEIGDYTLITSNAAVISAFVCLGMMTAVIIPETDRESRKICRLISVATFLFTTIIIIIMICISDEYQFFNLQGVVYRQGLIVLWLYVICNTIYSICYGYANRLKLYSVMFWNPIIGAGVNMGVSIIFGVMGMGFVGYTSANILSLILNIVHLIRHANPYFNENVGLSEYKELVKKYKRFPIFQMPSNLLDNIGAQMPIWTIKAIYGASPVGMYSMTMRILGLPSTLLATPINRIYFQEASQRYSRGENIGEFSFKILETNIKIAIIPIMIIVIFGQQIFALFLGANWKTAGLYASILGIYQLILFCGNCLSGYFVIIRKNSWNLIVALSTLVIQGILYVVFTYLIKAEIYSFLMAFSFVMIAKHVIAHSLFFKHVGFDLRKYYWFVFKYIGIPMIITYTVFALAIN